MRLGARLVIAGVAAVAVGAAAAGCSATPGRTEATRPGPVLSPSPTRTVPAGPVLEVRGAPKGVKAKAGMLVDVATGQVLWARGANSARPIASIAKVMTALVILRAGGVNRKITVPKAVTAYVAKNDANAVGLIPGQILTADQLLHGMLIESAADAAYTLASAYGPGPAAFVRAMNVEAATLGLTHTHFTSPDGLPYPTGTSTYSTPAELIKLGEVAMKYPEFRSIVRLQYYRIPKAAGHSAYSFTSSNELIGLYRGVIGIKTGFTDAAGHTLLFEAVRSGRTLIGVVLGSPASGPESGAQDAAKVLNWGFTLTPTG